MEKPSRAFLALHEQLLALAMSSRDAGAVRALPRTPGQLARMAAGLPEFADYAQELYRIERRPSIPEELPEFEFISEEDAEYQLEAAQDLWDCELEDRCSDLQELLKRSGYYNALATLSGDYHQYESIVTNRTRVLETNVIRLYSLRGCKFGLDRFELAGLEVVRLDPSELEALGSGDDVCKAFFPNEIIKRDEFEKSWFLRVECAEATRGPVVIEGLDGELSLSSAPFTGSEIERKFFTAILLLSLYQQNTFSIDRVLVCEPHWRVTPWQMPILSQLSFNKPYSVNAYAVTAERQPSFGKYLALIERGHRNAASSKDKGALAMKTGIRRYLQATFARGDVLGDWKLHGLVAGDSELFTTLDPDRSDIREDALLRYVFMLEALLIGDDKEAIAEKVAVCVALIIGRGDQEKAELRKFMKTAYRARSNLAHGKDASLASRDSMLSKLRVVCQRILLVILTVYANEPEFDLKKLKDLPISTELQSDVARARDNIFSLIADGNPLDSAT